jgi:hypothetical protein
MIYNRISKNRIETTSSIAGVIDGINRQFVTSSPFRTGSLEVYLNGLLMEPGVEITEINNTTFEFIEAPLPNDNFVVTFLS